MTSDTILQWITLQMGPIQPWLFYGLKWLRLSLNSFVSLGTLLFPCKKHNKTSCARGARRTVFLVPVFSIYSWPTTSPRIIPEKIPRKYIWTSTKCIRFVVYTCTLIYCAKTFWAIENFTTGMITAMDTAIGDVLSELSSQSLVQDTITIFTSDVSTMWQPM